MVPRLTEGIVAIRNKITFQVGVGLKKFGTTCTEEERGTDGRNNL